MLCVAGSINMDLVARVPHIPAPGETVLGDALQRFHGGKGANQAVAAARLGAPVQFFGAVGDDAFGAELRRGLVDEGIACSGLVQVAGASGCALINVASDGDNAITVLPGANSQAPLPPAGWSAALLLLQLEIPLATVTVWAQAARRGGIEVLLNAAPMTPLPAELLGAVDVLLVNRGELAELAGTTDVEAALTVVARRGPRRIVVTLGGDGCLAHDAGQTMRLPGVAVDVVDSTGAGDCFAGALAASLHDGLPFADALARANRAAALSCTVAGARGGMPTLNQLV